MPQESNSQNSHAGVYLASIATALPDFSADQEFAAELLRANFGPKLTKRSLSLIRATFAHPSIGKRHFAVDDPACIMNETPDQRIARFTEGSIELAARAATRALERAGVEAREVTGLVVNTCTGYICPGISTYLLERLGLPGNTRVYDLVGSGCGGALPNLQVAESMVKSSGGIVVSVAVEICSAAFQMDNDLSLILSNALFGDGAAAAVLCDGGARATGSPLFELVASAGRYLPEQRESIRFVHKNGALYNQLSTDLPKLVGEAAYGVVGDLLAGAGLEAGDVGHWALHTGGDKIICAVQGRLGLPDDALKATRKVLRNYGNMSSPTVWFVLDELERAGIAAGQWCVMLAYGAGLSAHAYLLKKCP